MQQLAETEEKMVEFMASRRGLAKDETPFCDSLEGHAALRWVNPK